MAAKAPTIDAKPEIGFGAHAAFEHTPLAQAAAKIPSAFTTQLLS